MFLDKFFELNPGQRGVYLMVLAKLQQTQILAHPEHFGLPTTDELKHNLSIFLARQPPRTQGQIAMFLRELKATRTALGMKDPF